MSSSTRRPSSTWRSLHQPVLLVVGGHDLDAVHLAADRLEAGACTCVGSTARTLAHLPSMEEPEVFLRLLLDRVVEQD